MIHNENSRVKIPALVHLTRLKYDYLSLKQYNGGICSETNIFRSLFWAGINRINGCNLLEQDIDRLLEELTIKLSNDDLGRAFYKILLDGINGLRIIDLEDESRNTYHTVTELTYRNSEDEFRPDITLLINGLPLAFVEVKKPNNRDGIIAEHNRINTRFSKEAFRRFVNITQLMVFSNNMEYDDSDPEPIEGAFYASSSYQKLFFNRFREEEPQLHAAIQEIDGQKEDFILSDNNLVSIKGTSEYCTNLNGLTPTNRILTSLFSHNRFLKLLKYGFAYVERTNKDGIKTLEKHVMRYPQFFATMAIEKKLDSGVKHGIIWHTQGSGKTALAFHNVRYLRDYYQKQGRVAKFYFIVDRLDLLTQAGEEFAARGLHVEKVNSKDDFIKNIRTIGTANNTGEDTITVVNIHKFSTESIVRKADYDVNVQRIYFLDEAHRSYNPKGSFLANLMASDREAVMIALTGTPLIGEGYNTKDVFGEYIHKYYYNRSIADGYTLKLIREGIKTEYRVKLQSILEELKMQEGSFKKRDIYAHPKYVATLVDYIVDDFKHSRIALGDSSIGGMIVCDSSDQARTVEETLKDYPEISHVLILHDVDDKETRRGYQEDFKKRKMDLLVVFNMLLTGFDAPRLKKQYLGRLIKEHNLLQTLTRVNRPYKFFRYGYVVDFADIRAEFDKTNEAYFRELQAELGDEFQRYRDIFKSQEEIEQDIQAIQDKLFMYATDNAELFSQQITALDDKQELLALRQALDTYKELINIIQLFGYEELAQKFTMENLHALCTEVNNRIAIVNLKQNMRDGEDVSGLLNLALDQIEFHFRKVSEGELVIADKFQDILEKTRQELERSLDTKDPEYISLLEELKRIFKKKNIEELTADEMKQNIQELERIRKAAAQQNLRDQMLCAKYQNDVKYMRTHKRIKATPPPIGSDPVIFDVLMGIKVAVDQKVLKNQRMMDNHAYFTREIMPEIIQSCRNRGVQPTASQVKFMEGCISSEYFAERTWTA
ncbi:MULTISPECIES: DEAD/DEAH box helicase family protein [unclassified Anaerotruncus]|uniref:type I restriction endonuclease subunit R n=1 Tax=Anaerotruncus sp. 1XD42-93 TaxID=2320853 RepID=UPI000EA2C861|nr:type I restriction endonuclease subunit R [Anaerotruncus sp. 1XD42-93]RKJ78575.1 type I restriction endonuclease subunit R [Anaerotruncus sp. 1XD22-93]